MGDSGATERLRAQRKAERRIVTDHSDLLDRLVPKMSPKPACPSWAPVAASNWSECHANGRRINSKI